MGGGGLSCTKTGGWGYLPFGFGEGGFNRKTVVKRSIVMGVIGRIGEVDGAEWMNTQKLREKRRFGYHKLLSRVQIWHLDFFNLEFFLPFKQPAFHIIEIVRQPFMTLFGIIMLSNAGGFHFIHRELSIE